MPAAPVEDRHPPDAVLKVINPVFRRVVSSPAGRLVRDIVVLEFAGRKTGRRYEIVVGWHTAGGQRVVFTPARWRVNFRGGIPVTVRHAGRRLAGTGTLVEDPAEVAAALQAVLDGGKKARDIGLKVEPGHQVTAEDVRHAGRAMIRLELPT